SSVIFSPLPGEDLYNLHKFQKRKEPDIRSGSSLQEPASDLLRRRNPETLPGPRSRTYATPHGKKYVLLFPASGYAAASGQSPSPVPGPLLLSEIREDWGIHKAPPKVPGEAAFSERSDPRPESAEPSAPQSAWIFSLF